MKGQATARNPQQIRNDKHVRWKVIFSATALVGLVQVIPYVAISLDFFWSLAWLFVLPNWAYLIICLWAVVSSIIDVRTLERRDWLHWVGVAMFIASRCVTPAWTIGPWFIRQ